MTTKNHRIFLAINLPEGVTRKLSDFQKEWFDFPVRLTRRENLHITLVFIGNVDTEAVLDVCKITKESISQEDVFEIKLNKICFGPLNNKPRMIWAIGENNENLSCLKNKLEDSFFNLNKNNIANHRNFYPHITLARIKQKEWSNLENKPDIGKDISLSFSVDSVEVMESFLSRKGPEYTILESISLK